jgi:hypothetical protein
MQGASVIEKRTLFADHFLFGGLPPDDLERCYPMPESCAIRQDRKSLPRARPGAFRSPKAEAM